MEDDIENLSTSRRIFHILKTCWFEIVIVGLFWMCVLGWVVYGGWEIIRYLR